MLKDITGRAAEQLEVEEGADLGAVFEDCARRFPRLRDYQQSIVVARNHQFSSRVEKLSDGDEVAFLPPVSGGSRDYLREIGDAEGHFFALTREAIDAQAIARRLLCGEDGAVVVFEGVVRNNTKGRPTLYLDYECYEPMAVKTMAEVGRQIAAAHAIGRIGMVHRLGRLEIGETSVAVVVTAPHRKPAFEAALEGINRLKRLVPIWKKEHFADGEVWVEGEWDAAVLDR
jgi:molybdopterin synthase catalytic subunit/molybdopterin converting factor small subunit